MHAESLVFFSRENPQRKKSGRKALIAHGHTRRPRTGERAKVSGHLLHVYSYRGRISYTPNVEHKVGWIMHKMLPFCSKKSGPILIMSWSHEKRYQPLHACTFRVLESLGTRLIYPLSCSTSLRPLWESQDKLPSLSGLLVLVALRPLRLCI